MSESGAYLYVVVPLFLVIAFIIWVVFDVKDLLAGTHDESTRPLYERIFLGLLTRRGLRMLPIVLGILIIVCQAVSDLRGLPESPNSNEPLELKSDELTTTLTCQRLEPSLPLTCEQKYYPCGHPVFCREAQRRLELWGARRAKILYEQLALILLKTNKGEINLVADSLGANWVRFRQIRNSINDFVENPEETASYDFGDSKLTIEDGRLTYEP